MNVFKNEKNEIRAFVLSASKGIEKSKLIDELSIYLGLSYNKYQDYSTQSHTNIFYYFNKSTCSFYDILIVSAHNENELAQLKDKINSHLQLREIPIKIILTLLPEDKVKSITENENNNQIRFIYKYAKASPEDFKKGLIKLYSDNIKSIEKIFNKFDCDKSGYIELCEINQMAKSLGENIKSEELKKAIMVLDLNHDDKISLEELKLWWKMKYNSEIFTALDDTNNKVNNLIFNIFSFNNLQKEIIKAKSLKLNKKSVTLKIDQKSSPLIKTRLNFNFSIGKKESLEGAQNYLSKFSDDLSYANGDWLSFGYFFKANSITKEESVTLVKSFKDKLFTFIDQNYFKGFENLFSLFFYCEILEYDYSVNLMIKLKNDMSPLLKSCLNKFFILSSWICNEGPSRNASSQKRKQTCVDFELTLASDKNILDLIINNKKIEDFLESTDLVLSGYYDKNKLQIIIQNLVHEYKSLFSDLKQDLLKDYIMSQNLNILFPFSDFLNALKNDKTTSILLNSLSRIEFTINLFSFNFHSELYI